MFVHNRLLFSFCYLSGPMDNCRHEGKVWREDFSKWLIEELGVIPLDPYNKPSNNGVEDDKTFALINESKSIGSYEEVRCLMKPVVAYDLRCVDKCDFVVAYLDMDYGMCGTIDEICMASSQNKPVVLCCPQGLNRIPNWLYGRLKPQMFHQSIKDTKEYLKHIAFAKNIDTLDRWKFFDISSTVKKIYEHNCN